ncbi:MAG: family 43 glycosylhydrolase, partial [Eubacteriales bacterium]|nr:family 43 glycosylhydrolase [Eubacteriales bacterium]
MKEITYRNPVLPGFYPDPSICRAGDDYYMVNSSFEFFPGVPIHHSKDLVHWKTIGHCISRSSQLKLPTGVQSCSGIFAPTIRYHEGRFYMITTNVVQTGENSEHGNFYMYTENPAGDWSDPVFLGTPGIDPSLFFDEDDTSWYVGTTENQIYLQKIDLQKGAMEGEAHILWKGSGGSYPEGPHLYRKGDWYYLMISEGGTERCHMLTIARSKNIFGPYEECPSNPVMTNRSLGLPIESAGHGDLIEDTKGNWWAVCLGTRNFGYPPCHNLGRETMLVPVDFSGDWPIFGDAGKVLSEFKVRELPGENAGEDPVDSFEDHFRSSVLHPSWNFIYNPDPSLFQIGKGALILRGNAHVLEDAVPLAWVGRRQQHHECRSEVTLYFQCSGEGEEAGLTVFT